MLLQQRVRVLRASAHTREEERARSDVQVSVVLSAAKPRCCLKAELRRPELQALELVPPSSPSPIDHTPKKGLDARKGSRLTSARYALSRRSQAGDKGFLRSN